MNLSVAAGPMVASPAAGGSGRKIQFVGVTVEKKQYLDLETLARAAFSVD